MFLIHSIIGQSNRIKIVNLFKQMLNVKHQNHLNKIFKQLWPIKVRNVNAWRISMSKKMMML